MKQPVTTFQGKEAAITWDKRLCIHVEECVRAKKGLFENGRKPWCEPDAAPPEEAADVVKRCPSGALAFRGASVPEETAEALNTVLVSGNGPYYVRGDLRIEGAPDDMPGVRFRAALCRCGESKRKPFCDNSHVAAGFKDSGAVGEKGPGFEAAGGPVGIAGTENGPFRFTGNFAIVAGSGREAWRGMKASLCRCGHSANKPFCDGSHKRVGFVSAPEG